ncbi:DoxX family protein [Tenacibaculum sp. M341]|nr:DoxX family membrane protein [Tenacibaculum sp. M341]
MNRIGVKSFLIKLLFLYIVFYIYPYGFEYIKGLNTDSISFWEKITIWFGETVIGWELNENLLYNGFDSKYDFSRFLLITIISVIVAAVWEFINFKLKVNHSFKLNNLTRVILRYHVGFTLILYGLSKVFMLQFGEMDLNKLESKMGDYTGMRFLWAFMSSSKLYTMTTGWVEVVGGILLLFRRFTFLGAFILLIAMINVVIIDIGYDVRVKMFAIHLLLMTIMLLSPYFKNLLNLFIYNKSTEPIVEKPLFITSKGKKASKLIKLLICVGIGTSFFMSFSERIERRYTKVAPTFTGNHVVQQFLINGDTIKQADYKWKSILFNSDSRLPGSVKVINESNKNNYYSLKADTLKKEITLYSFRDTSEVKAVFVYKKRSKKEFVFKGKLESDSIFIKTKVHELNEYRLMEEIRWITDYGDFKF